MNRSKLGPALGVLLVLAGLACRDRLPAPDVVARISDEEIRFQDFEGFLQENLGEGGSSLASDVLSPLFDQFLTERLLVQMALDREVVEPGTTGRQAVTALLEAELASGPGEDAVRAYYEDHRNEFTRPDRVHLRQILVEERATAEQALEQLRSGVEFGEVARSLSREPQAQYGGDQGELAKEDLPPPFGDAVFALQEGEITEILAADYGFHIFQVMEHLPAEVIALEDAREHIVDLLRRKYADESLERLVTEAREDYNVQVYASNLPFNYVGVFASIADSP